MKNWLKHLPFVRLFCLPVEPRTERQDVVDFFLAQFVGAIIGTSLAVFGLLLLKYIILWSPNV